MTGVYPGGHGNALSGSNFQPNQFGMSNSFSPGNFGSGMSHPNGSGGIGHFLSNLMHGAGGAIGSVGHEIGTAVNGAGHGIGGMIQALFGHTNGHHGQGSVGNPNVGFGGAGRPGYDSNGQRSWNAGAEGYTPIQAMAQAGPNLYKGGDTY